MCGRFALYTDSSTVESIFGFGNLFKLNARYNIAPTQQILALRVNEHGDYEWCEMRWGFVPHWMKKSAISGKFINARAETVHEKPMFKRAFFQRRCLIVASGFYEWTPSEGGKIPYYIHTNTPVMGFAGIWEHWQDEESEFDSCTILTTTADDNIQKLHSRMPVIVEPHDHKLWLKNNDAKLALNQVLDHHPRLDYYPVSQKVNNARYDEADCINELKD